MLTYVNETKKQGDYKLYKCQCSHCQDFVYVRSSRIKTQESCGCYRSKDRDGFRCGKLTYTGKYKTGNNKNKTRMYHALCDCGNETWTHVSSISKKQSCKCGLKDRPKRYSKNRSKYFVNGFLRKCAYGAKTRGIEFDLKLEDLDHQYEKQDGKCYYTGVKLILPKNSIDCQRDYSSFNVSIDRLDSSGSYNAVNIVLVLKDINYMKCDLSHAEFINFCKMISNNWSNV